MWLAVGHTRVSGRGGEGGYMKGIEGKERKKRGGGYDSRSNYMKIYELNFRLRSRRKDLDRVVGSRSEYQRV